MTLQVSSFRDYTSQSDIQNSHEHTQGISRLEAAAPSPKTSRSPPTQRGARAAADRVSVVEKAPPPAESNLLEKSKSAPVARRLVSLDRHTFYAI